MSIEMDEQMSGLPASQQATASTDSNSNFSNPTQPTSSSTSNVPHISTKQPVGILKSSQSRKRRSMVWDESNLAANEQERIERGPRMKIDEPKTPYQGSIKSPTQQPCIPMLNEEGDQDETMQHQSTTPMGEFSLADRIADISAAALSRREAESREWESDESDDLDDEDATSMDTTSPSHTNQAHGHRRSNQASITEHPNAATIPSSITSHHHPTPQHIAHLHPHPPQPPQTIDTMSTTSSPARHANIADSDSITTTPISAPQLDPFARDGHLSGVELLTPSNDQLSPDSSSVTPEVKHRIFESKRKGNYHSMGALLKQRPIQDDDDDEE